MTSVRDTYYAYLQAIDARVTPNIIGQFQLWSDLWPSITCKNWNSLSEEARLKLIGEKFHNLYFPGAQYLLDWTLWRQKTIEEQKVEAIPFWANQIANRTFEENNEFLAYLTKEYRRQVKEIKKTM